MATAKERNDERQRDRATREREREASTTTSDPGDHAQEQGDGQPENVRELEDRSSGSGQASIIRDD